MKTPSEKIKNPLPLFLVSECGLYFMFKTGFGLTTRYIVLQYDPDGDNFVSQWVGDRLGVFYHPRSPWNFPYTVKPFPQDCVLPDGWVLQAAHPKGFQRVITTSTLSGALTNPAYPSGTFARFQIWDGDEFVTYIEGDFLSLQRLIGLGSLSDWQWLADLSDGLDPVMDFQFNPLWAVPDVH